MNRKGVISSVLFVLSNTFAIASISTPSWIVNDFSGRTRLGLTEVCVLFKEQDPKDEVCEPFKLPSHWALTLVFIVIGICLTFLTIMLVLLSIWKPQSEKIARVIGFFAVMFFCIAAIIFPFGFGIDEIGGQPYKLPAHTEVGYSYFLFCASIFVLSSSVAFSNVDVIRNNLHR